MRNVVLIAIVLALAVAAIRHDSGSSTSGSPTATHSTKSNAFLASQHKYDQLWGDRATDDELMAVGRTICALHKRGMSDANILNSTVGYHLPSGKARTLGLQRIRDARKYLCP